MGVLICQLCNHTITSQEHHTTCNTIMMCDIKESIVSSEFKPMMTFGLGGCTVLLMVFFTKDTNSVCNIVFGHHYSKNTILEWFTNYYKEEYNIIIIIKTPGEYENKNGKWYMVAKEPEYWHSNIKKDNLKIIIEPYNLSQTYHGNNVFNSTLYFKTQPKLQYSDCNGRYIDINY